MQLMESKIFKICFFSFIQCDPAYSASMFMDLLREQPGALMILAAACSDVTELLAELSAHRQLAQVRYHEFHRSPSLSPSLFYFFSNSRTNERVRVQSIKTTEKRKLIRVLGK